MLKLKLTMKNKSKIKGKDYNILARLQDQSESDIDEDYEIQMILDHRLKRQYKLNYIFDQNLSSSRNLIDVPNYQLQFYVRWKGYGPEFQSWEPGENLQNAPNVVEQYKISNSMLGTKSKGSVKARGRKPKVKEVEKGTEQKLGSKARGFKFDKIYDGKQKVVKEDQQNSDDLCIIDQAAFFQGTIKSKRKKQPTKNDSHFQQAEQKSIVDVPQEPMPLSSQKRVISNEIQVSRATPILKLKSEEPPKEKRIVELKLNMSQNNGKFISKTFQQPSQSYSSFLNQHPLQRNNEIEKQKNSIEPNFDQLRLQSEQQTSLLKFRNKRNKLILASIFDGLDSEEQQKEISKLRMLEQKLRLVDSLEENREQRIFIEPIEGLENKAVYNQKNKNSCKRQKVFQFAPEETSQKLKKKIKTNDYFESNCSLNSQKQQKSRIPESYQRSEMNPPNINEKKNNFEIVLRETTQIYQKPIQINIINPVRQILQKSNLNERIDREIKSLYETEPINFLEQYEGKASKNDIVNKRLQSNKVKSCNLSLNFCSQCSKTKLSQDLLVDYIKYYLQEMNDENCSINLERIYEEQQTYILVNGLNPNLEIQKSDKIKKIVMVQNKPFLQDMIVRKLAKQEQIDEIVAFYKIGKIILSKGQWYAVFRIQKLMYEKSHYRYVKVKDLVKNHQQKIFSFLTNKE